LRLVLALALALAPVLEQAANSTSGFAPHTID
jgi:hypothetical protein